MGLVSKRLNEMVNSEVNANGKLSNEQCECARKCLYGFDSELPKTNYIVIKGETQCGKTGVLFALVNIINKLELKESLGINRILYITGDNSKDLVKQQEERAISSLMSFRDEDIKIKFLKRSDFKKFTKEGAPIDNSIIFIDESHYGTKAENNQLPQFLSYYGIDYLKNTNLEEHNIHIISNTATPYCEIASDAAKSKLYVTLIPSYGYIGILNFAEADNVIPLSKNIFDKNIIDAKLPELLNNEYERLKSIEESTGKIKCGIMRIGGKNDLRNIEKYANGKFHIYQFDTSRGGALNYDNLWNKIDLYCRFGEDRENGEYLLILVKDALRMGISIRDRKNNNKTKNSIAFIYDYASSGDKPEVTEQGLLGRMCGYRSDNDNEWRDIHFYLNEIHWYTLKNFYEGYKNHKTMKPIKIANKRLEKEEIDSVEGLTMGSDYKLGVKNITNGYYIYDITDFVKKKGYTVAELKDNNGKGHFKYVENILYPYTKEVLNDERYENGTYLTVQSGLRAFEGMKTSYRGYDKYIENMQDEDAPIDMTGDAYPWTKKIDSIGKYAYEWILDLNKAEDLIDPHIYIKIKMGQVYPYREVPSYEDGNGVKTAETMITE